MSTLFNFILKSRAERTFKEVDLDSSGSVSKQELKKWLQVLNKEEQSQKTNFWLQKWDEDQSGTVSWSEYLQSFLIDGLEGEIKIIKSYFEKFKYFRILYQLQPNKNHL